MNRTLPRAQDLLYGTAAKSLDAPAVIEPGPDGSERTMSYKELYALVDKFESFYKEQGVGAKDRVLLCSPNLSTMVAAVLAAWRRRALAMPVDVRMTAAELANVAQRVGTKVSLISSRFQNLAAVQEALTGKVPCFTLEAVADMDVKLDPSKINNESSDFPALLILTSGTTGMPKGAVHDFASLLVNLGELGDAASMDDKTKCLLPLPISHIFGLEVMGVALVFGGTLVFCELEPSRFIGSLNRNKPQVVAGVPTLYAGLLHAPEGAVDLKNARVLLSGGAPLPVALAGEFESRFGKRLNNGYGSTESKIIALNIDGPVESVGRPVPSTKVKILDGNGQILPEGQEGEIVIDSRILMTGYLDQPEKTSEVLSENGYRTGDIGFLKDGYIFISGRAKEMIVVAGNKVFPNEVEQVLMKNPAVAEVAITGQDHSKLGQIVKATIVLSPGDLDEKLLAAKDDDAKKAAREALVASFKEFSKDNLKRELRPMVWDFRPSSETLPKLRSGKIDKKQL
jgi:Acyl-CoA synthetases (AMP-forming)/AMP-acid ligases II